MSENGKAECGHIVVEREIRQQLHDLSNTLTVLVGRVELLSRNGEFSEKDKKEIRNIVNQGFACFAILEKARCLFKNAA